jgi:hypothetical protein
MHPCVASQLDEHAVEKPHVSVQPWVHSAMVHVPVSSHDCAQLLPEHFVVQDFAPEQSVVQLPPAQENVHVEFLPQTNLQRPWGHSRSQL